MSTTIFNFVTVFIVLSIKFTKKVMQSKFRKGARISQRGQEYHSLQTEILLPGAIISVIFLPPARI